MHATRRALLALPTLLAAPALAQPAFPARPLRLVVGYPPGGVTDIVARIVAEPLGRVLGQPVVVENRAGAGGNIGAQNAAQSEPDGHTLLLATAAMVGVNPVLYARGGADPMQEFVAIGTINDMANVLSVNPRRMDVPDLKALVARGKQGGVIYGSVGNGSSSHFCAVTMLRMAGFDATHVPYRGSSPAVAALLAAEVDFLFDTTATSTSHIRAGTFRALGASSGRRASALPEVLTLAEAGIPGYDISVWNTLAVHRATPAPLLQRLQQAFGQAMDDTMRARLRAAFVDPLEVPPADLPRWLANERARWLTLAREARIQAD